MFKNVPLLQAERLKLVNRLRNATAGTVRVLSENMTENLMLPQRNIGIRFLVETVMLIVFVTCLTVLAINEKDPESLREASRSVEQWADIYGAKKVGTRAELIDFIAQVPEVLGDLVGTNIVVGNVGVSLLRTHVKTCDPPDGIPMAFGEQCLGDFRVTDWATLPYGGPNYTFYSVPTETLCFGWICAEPIRSPVATHILSYPPPNYRVAFHNGDAYIASRDRTSLNPQKVPVRTLYPDTNTNNATARARRVAILCELFDSFVDRTTRLVVVEVTMLNPFYMMLTDVSVMFELPASGGVFPTVDPRSVIVSEGRTQTNFTSGFVLAYSAFYLMIMMVTLMWTVFSSNSCVACGAGTSSVLMFNCVKCQGPNELTLNVSACTRCGAPVPALRHRCWRRVLDIWYVYTACNLIACIVWRYAVFETMPHLRSMIASEVDYRRQSPDYVSFVSFAQSTEIVRTSAEVVTFCIVLTFIKCFNVICRGQTTSRFMRIFIFGLPELIPFVVTVMFTFSGFAFAMHITLGYNIDVYSTVSASFLANYRILTLNAEWTTEANAFERATATLLFVLFVIVSVFLMMNIFPSVLSVAYRRALATPQYDVEVLSLWQMVKPFFRKAGVVKSRRIGRRRARSITATLEDSFNDVELNDETDQTHRSTDGGGRVGDGDSNTSGILAASESMLLQSPSLESDQPALGEQNLTSPAKSIEENQSDGDWSDSQSEVSAADTASTAFVDDMREFDELKVAVNGDTRMMRTQMNLRELERTAEQAYLNSLDMEDKINTASRDISSLRDELKQLTALLPTLALGGTSAMLRQRGGSVISAGRPSSAVPRRASVASSKLLPGDDDDDCGLPSPAPQSERARRASMFALGGAPPMEQSVSAARTPSSAATVPAVDGRGSWTHVDSDDDDDLVDTTDQHFERSFRQAFPSGHVPPPATSSTVGGGGPHRSSLMPNVTTPRSPPRAEPSSVAPPTVVESPVAAAPLTAAPPGGPESPKRKRRLTIVLPGETAPSASGMGGDASFGSPSGESVVTPALTDVERGGI